LFRVIDKLGDRALVMCWPLTGRTHQIRVHMAAVGHPIWADEIYGHVPTTTAEKTDLKLGLRAIRISYKDPFMAEQVSIEADAAEFVKLHGFDPSNEALRKFTAPEKALEHPKARFEELRREEKDEREKLRSERRDERAFGEVRDDSRNDWQQDEDSGSFASEQANPGGAPFRERPPREFGRGPRSDTRFSDRPQRKPGFGGQSDGPRKFEPRAGGYGRKPAGGGYSGGGGGGGRDFGSRPPQRPSYGKPAGGPREFSDGVGGGAGERPRSFEKRDDRGGAFRGPPRDKPGYGRSFADRGPRDDRRAGGGGGGFRPPAGGRPPFARPPEERGDDWGNREGANERRPGVFPSSAKPGLQAGFQKGGGFGGGAGRPAFRSSGAGRGFGAGNEGRPNRFGGGNRPFRGGGEGKPSGEWRGDSPRPGGRPPGKFGGGKPAFGKKPAGRPFKKFQ